MKTETQVQTVGMGFGGWLTILFVALKLTGYIAWSWIWVLSPLWIPVALILAFILICAVVAGFCQIASKCME